MGAIFSRIAMLTAPCFLQFALVAPSSRTAARKLLQDKATRDAVVGKAAVVTGVTFGGVGFYVAQALALEAGMAVFLCGRNVEKVRDAARRIADQAEAEGKKKPTLYPIIIDLDDLDEVQRASEDIAEILRRDHGGELQFLINNAGAVVSKFRLTKQGIESNVGGNYVGPFLLTRELLPNLRLAGNKHAVSPRVVNVSSIAHAFGTDYTSTSLLEAPERGGASEGVVSEDKKRDDGQLSFRWGEAGSLASYALSKNMQIGHCRSISKLEKHNGVRAVSCHPGSVSSNFGTKFSPSLAFIRDLYYNYLFGPFNYSPDQGGATPIHCALSPAINDAEGPGGRGAYYHATRHEVLPITPAKGDFDDVFYQVTSQVVDEKLAGMVM
jgi:retinol dehydrogenase-12